MYKCIKGILVVVFNFNHIVYAEIWYSPSIRGLQCLLNVCGMYAMEHDIIYDAKKSKCICIRPKSMIDMCDHVFMLSGNVLACTKCLNYLWVEIMFIMLKFNGTNSIVGGK